MTLTEFQQKKLTKLFDAYDFDSSKTLAKSDFQLFIDDLTEKLDFQKGSNDYQKVESQLLNFWSDLHQKVGITQDEEITSEAWLSYFDRLLVDENFQSLGIDGSVDLIFNIIDKDGDGKISLEEYTTLLKSWRISEGEIGGIYSKLDLNGDGSLSREELRQLYQDFYYSNDPSAPGNLIHGLV
ncbi:EF-hand domain-containing protein [Microcoleus sp. C2C3]|uniref:EF-hand domain-containing protein n=1 Tax=unclassified Microcoleus TaxID=2642155 RepID=UPI002FD09AB4